MRRLLIGVTTATGVLALAVGAGGQQAPVFRGRTENVPVYVTVTDKASRLVTDLARDDFTVSDNGHPQPLTLFDNTPQPVRLVVMLDISGSMYGNLPLLRAACEQLVTRLGPGDQARLGPFGADITIGPAFTADRAALLEALPASIPREAPTPLWTALDSALDGFAGVEGRRVVLVLSDGKDSGPVAFRRYVTEVQVIDRAQREEVMMYAVGLESRGAPRALPGRIGTAGGLMADMPDPGLGTLAAETGGGYFEITPADDLGAAFARVADELHSQYLLGFAPPDHDGKRHRIEVRVGRPGLKVRARKNYVAPKGGADRGPDAGPR
jgi:Ca-activated chloride channel family protein